jgi:ribose transport system permease protein
LVLAFAASGFFSGLAAIVFTARIVSGDPIGGGGLNMEAIAAAVIGGVNLFGGRGTLLGACIGAVIYGLITNVLNLYGVNPNYTEVAGGVIILIAAYANVASMRSKR